MNETCAHYQAASGIRPPRTSGRVRGVVYEWVPGGGVELWSCAHDHAPGVNDMRALAPAQRADAEQCAARWLRDQIRAGRFHDLPVEVGETS